MRIKHLFLVLPFLFMFGQACTERDPFPLDWRPKEIDFNRLQTNQAVQVYISKVAEESVTLTDVSTFGNGSRLDPSSSWLRRASGVNFPFVLNNEPGEIQPGVSFTVVLDLNTMPASADTAEIAITYQLDGRPEGVIRIPISLPKARRERNLTNNLRSRQSYPVKFSPSGSSILYNSNQRRNSQGLVFDGYLMGITGEDIRRVTDSKVGENSYIVDINPSESLVLYYTDYPNGSREIFYKNILEDEVTQITNNGAINTPVAFNQSGNVIAFNSNMTGSFGVYTYSLLSPENQRQTRISIDAVNEFAIGWSPNRDDILISRQEGGVSQIYLSTNQQSPLSLSRNFENNDIPVEISSNDIILFFSERQSRREVYRMSTAASGLRALTNNNVYDFPVTYFDGASKVLYYSTDFLGHTNIFMIEDVLGATPRQITGFRSSQIPVDIHPNNNTVLYYSERFFKTVDIFVVDIE